MGQQQVPDKVKPRAAKEIWNANASEAETRLQALEAAVVIGGVPSATTTQAGAARLATQADVDGGIVADEIVTPATLADRLNDFQSTAEKNANNGYMGLNAQGIADPIRLASGIRDGTRFLRDDGTYASVVTGGVVDASTSAKGIVLLDKAPVVAASPIVVGQNSSFFETFIEGLLLDITFAMSNFSGLTISSGAAWIPGLNKVLNAPSAIIPAAGTPLANTMYYGYLFSNGGTPAVEFSTTVPSSPYKGSARTKSGDNTRRYIGAIKTNASARIFNFQHFKNGDVFYKENQSQTVAPWALGNPTSPAATGTTYSLGPNATAANRVVPVTSRLAWIAIYISSGIMTLSTSDDPLTDTSGTGRAVQGPAMVLHAVPLNSVQDFIMSSGAVHAYVSGYRDDR